MLDSHPKRILLAVLNWGLGHATRCIPLIESWLSKGYHVTLASDGIALQYLRAQYPSLLFLELPTLDIRYSSRWPAWWMIGIQGSKIGRHRNADNSAIQSYLRVHPCDCIVSDNRYGCWAEHIPSIFLTHQIQPIAPNGLRWLVPSLYRGLKGWMEYFDQVWVPDSEGVDASISGRLGHPSKQNLVNRYIGPLSRLQQAAQPEAKDSTVLALISGPEPQRTIFEKKVLAQVKNLPGRAVVIGGKLMASGKDPDVGIEYLPFADGPELSALLQRSRLVVARSGYSSLMDLIRLRVPALLVPTPGQTEQIYLAHRAADMFGFTWRTQRKLNISAELEKMEEKPLSVPASLINSFNQSNLMDPFERDGVPG